MRSPRSRTQLTSAAARRQCRGGGPLPGTAITAPGGPGGPGGPASVLALVGVTPRPRSGRAFLLPGAGKCFQRGNVKVAIVRTFLVQRAPDLLGDGRGEHVQDLVALVAQL